MDWSQFFTIMAQIAVVAVFLGAAIFIGSALGVAIYRGMRKK